MIYIFIPDTSGTVIPRSMSDEESCLKDFSLPLEMTLWADFQCPFALLPAKMLRRRNKSLYTKTDISLATASINHITAAFKNVQAFSRKPFSGIWSGD